MLGLAAVLSYLNLWGLRAKADAKVDAFPRYISFIFPCGGIITSKRKVKVTVVGTWPGDSSWPRQCRS